MLRDEILSSAAREEVDQVLKSADFHLLLRVTGLGAHVREKSDGGQFEELWVDVGLIREDIKASSTKLK